MPDPQKSLEDELFGAAAPTEAAPSLEEELFGAAEPVQDEAAIADARNLAEHQPLRGEQTPQHESPWYTNAFRDAGAPATFAENLASGALANTTDEIGAAAIGSSPEIYGADNNQGYEGIPAQTSDQQNDYAAGSQFEDNRRTLEAEKAGRDKENPVAAISGQVGGGLLQAAALPEAALTTGLGGAAAGAGLTAANYMGQGSGNLDERAGQALQTADDNPFATVASVALPAVAGAAGGAMKNSWAPALAEKSAINRTAAVMTPGQRATHAANKGGKPGLVRLGNDIVDAGLHKKNPSGGWWSNLIPASAENMYDNAVALKAKAGPQLQAAESAISQHNPTIKVGDISQDLRAGADDVAKNALTDASDKEALYRREIAARIDDSTNKLPGTAGPAPTAPVARPPEGPWTPPKEAVYENPAPEEIAAYQAKLVPPELPKQQPKEGPWTAEIPEQKAAPEDWAAYLENVKKLPEGAALPPGPSNQPYVPARGPGVVDPSAADFRDYHKALAAHQNPGPAPAPKLIEPAVPPQPPGPSVVTDKDWQDYLLAEKAHKNPEPIPSGESPFDKLVAQKRELDKQTNFSAAGGIENAGMKDQVHRQVGTAIRQHIRSGLDDAAAQNPSLVQPVKDWNNANKSFSLASTVEDPALVAMQKEYGGNLGLRDMATASAAQAMGIPGPLAMAAGKLAKGGRGANALAGTQQNLSKVFHGLGTAAGPAALSGTQAALPNPKIVREKNASLKEQLSDALSESWGWFKEKVVD